MAASAPSILPGISPPLGVVTATDQGGLVAIVTAVLLSIVLISFLIRLYVRFKNSPLQQDDGVLAVSVLFSCIQSAIVFLQVHNGFGKSEELIDPRELISVQKAAYASDILYIFTLFLSKCALALLYQRLTRNRSHSRAVWAIITASALWAFISIILVAIRCNPAHPWTNFSAQCPRLFVRWLLIGVFDSIIEMALFSMSLYLVWGLKMRLKSKATVVAAFGSRVPVILVCSLRLYYLNREILSTNPTLTEVAAVCCTQIQLGYAIMATTIPCLKPFMAAYEAPRSSSYKASDGQYSSGISNSSAFNSKSRKSAIQLEGFKIPTSGEPTVDPLTLRPDKNIYQTTISHHDPSRAPHSIDSNDSRQMIIKKVTGWSIESRARSSRDEEPENEIQSIGREPS